MLVAVAEETSIHVQDIGRLYNLVSGERLEMTLLLIAGQCRNKANNMTRHVPKYHTTKLLI